MYVDLLFSGFKVCSEIQSISHPSQQLVSVLTAPAVYSHLRKRNKGHLRSKIVEYGTDQCAILRVLSWAEASRDWYHTHNTYLLLSHLLCEIFMHTDKLPCDAIL